MADVAASSTPTCGRCGQHIASRGGRPPVYCSVCGQRFAPLADNVEHRFEPAPNVEHRFRAARRDRWAGGAVLALGVIALVPGCGFLFAVAALALGLATMSDAGDSRRLGIAGMAFGALSVFMHLSCWGVCRL